MAVLVEGVSDYLRVTEFTAHRLVEMERLDLVDFSMHIYLSEPKVRSITLWFWSNETKIQTGDDTDNYLFLSPDFAVRTVTN